MSSKFVSINQKIFKIIIVIIVFFLLLFNNTIYFYKIAKADDQTIFSDNFSTTTGNGAPTWNPNSGGWYVDSGTYKHQDVGRNYIDTQNTPYSNDFESAKNLTEISGTFSLSAGNGKDGTQGLLASGATTKSRINIADALNWTDYTIDLDFKRAGGLGVYGYSIIYFRGDADLSDGYALFMRQTGVVELWKRVGDAWSALTASKVDGNKSNTLVADNNWRDLIVQVKGTVVKVWIDKATTQDPDIQWKSLNINAGTIGLGTNSWDSYFDNISITTDISISASPPLLYNSQANTSIINIASAEVLDGLSLTVKNPAGTTWTNNTAGGSGNRSVNVTFPNDFTGANITTSGTYLLTATLSNRVSHYILEVKDNPILRLVHSADLHYDSRAGFSALSNAEFTAFVNEVNNETFFPEPSAVILEGDITQTEDGLQTTLQNELTTAKGFFETNPLLNAPHYYLMGNHDNLGESAPNKGTTWNAVIGNYFDYTVALDTNNLLVITTGSADALAGTNSHGTTFDSAARQTWLQNIFDTNPDKDIYLIAEDSFYQPRTAGSAQNFYETSYQGSNIQTIINNHADQVKLVLAGQCHLFSIGAVNSIFSGSTQALNAGEFRYLEIYADRIESSVYQTDWKYKYGAIWDDGSSDATHNAKTEYIFGQPYERDFILSENSLITKYNLTLAGNNSWEDYQVSSTTNLGFRRVAGIQGAQQEDFGGGNDKRTQESANGPNTAGLVGRYTDVNNYYLATLDSRVASNGTGTVETVKLYKRVNGVSTQLDSQAISKNVNTNIGFKLKIDGSNIKVYVDDVEEINVTDLSLAAGKFGLSSYGDATFDNILVTDLGGPNNFSLSSPANNYSTNDTTPTLSWNAATDPESTIAGYDLYIDGALNRSNISSTSTTPASILSLGSHTWYVLAKDPSNHSTQSSDTRTISIYSSSSGSKLSPSPTVTLTPTPTPTDTATPQPEETAEETQNAAPAPSAVTEPTTKILVEENNQQEITLEINQNFTLYTTRPIFKGTTVPDAKITLEIYSDPIIGKTTSDKEGNWRYQPDQDIPLGDHTVRITVQKNEQIVYNNEFKFSIVDETKTASPSPTSSQSEAKEKLKISVWKWIGLGLGSLIVLALIIIAIKKRKKV